MAHGSAEIRNRREQMLLRLLVRLFRVMNDETVERTIARGHPQLQPSHPRLLAYVDTERGSRVNELAKKMGVTRQAVSQLLDDVEAAGCVERRPDPDDARAVRVHFTAKGRRQLADAMDAMEELEAEYAELVGPQELKKVKQVLSALLEKLDPEGALERS